MILPASKTQVDAGVEDAKGGDEVIGGEELARIDALVDAHGSGYVLADLAGSIAARDPDVPIAATFRLDEVRETGDFM